MVGTAETRLIIIRGNPSSGKTTLARTIRGHIGHGVAVVGHKELRRYLLGVIDKDGTPTPGLMDAIARYCLDQGMHVVLEGVMPSQWYSDMLKQLAADHEGITRSYWFDLHFDETLARHRNKPQMDYTEEKLKESWTGTDLIEGLEEGLLLSEDDYEANCHRILHDTGLSVYAYDDDDERDEERGDEA